MKSLDLSHIVHQGAKSTTARLLGRTRASLEVFVAPQASFAINCWASLSKCTRLRVLDLSLSVSPKYMMHSARRLTRNFNIRVSECISFQSLNQTIRQLGDLRELYLPRCSSRYERHQVVPASAGHPSLNILRYPDQSRVSSYGTCYDNQTTSHRRSPH